MEHQEVYQSQIIIPLFPLGLVLLPHMTLPLHIFEERYKLMINECMDQDKPFGIVYFEGNHFQKVGCTSRIINVLKRYEDGRMDIVTRGEKRFYIEHIDEEKMYLRAGVFFIDDAIEATNDEDKILVHEALELLRRLDQMIGDTRDYDQLYDLNLKQLSFIIPGSAGLRMEERQKFLEMMSAGERLKKGIEVLKKVIPRAQINRQITDIIGGNGHIRVFLEEKGLIP
ncbi:LON peptidase substrate-binding domain-containing protein [Thermodesulfobacteriota bacterium]